LEPADLWRLAAAALRRRFGALSGELCRALQAVLRGLEPESRGADFFLAC